MYTNVQIINIGLSKMGQSRIERIDPPRSSLERHCAENYENWKRTELAKRRWVFALEIQRHLAQVDTLEDAERPYVYALPSTWLRPVRGRFTEWRQAGRKLYSREEGLRVDGIVNVPESEFDPLFVDVLACWAMVNSSEYVTQSNTKGQSAQFMYNEAVAAAKQANAYVIGPEDIGADDSEFPFIYSRYA